MRYDRGARVCRLSVLTHGALLLGSWGGFAGALGLTIADLTSGYVTTAPQTFVLKMIIGLITVLVSRKVFHLDSETDLRSQTRIALFSSMAALGANVILDPLVGYFYKTYIFGIPPGSFRRACQDRFGHDTGQRHRIHHRGHGPLACPAPGPLQSRQPGLRTYPELRKDERGLRDAFGKPV